jgi:3-phenylpropionate/cinnamic acid dioxygenase small subunit
VTITTEDRLAIHELVALHGHLVDDGLLDQLSEVFTDDVAYDLRPLGGSLLHGLVEVREATELGRGNPLAHLVTNTVVAVHGEQVYARSKFLGVRAEGTVGSGTYIDELRRTAVGWRIDARRVSLDRDRLVP